jgi:hypothetical protein
MLFNKVIYIVLIFFSCHTIRNQKSDDNYLADLKVKNVKSQFISPEIPKRQPGQPVSTERGIIDIEFYILVENIGSGDWKNDLCICYHFEGVGSQNENYVIFEDLMIPYASSQEVTFMVNNIFQKPETVTFTINPNRNDSVGCAEFSEELFYNNNTYKYILRK